MHSELLFEFFNGMAPIDQVGRPDCARQCMPGLPALPYQYRYSMSLAGVDVASLSPPRLSLVLPRSREALTTASSCVRESPSFLLPPKARRTHESRNVVPGRPVSSPVIGLGRESIMTTPRGNHAKIARAAAARSTPEAQFQRMYQENRDLIYHYVLNWVGNHEDAEDLTADIFLRADPVQNVVIDQVAILLIHALKLRLWSTPCCGGTSDFRMVSARCRHDRLPAEADHRR